MLIIIQTMIARKLLWPNEPPDYLTPLPQSSIMHRQERKFVERSFLSSVEAKSRQEYRRGTIMRIVVTGANGQLGRACLERLGREHEVIALGHAELELERPDCVERLVATAAELVIHPAAYTNVDGCARDPVLAYRVNGLGTRYVALACQQLNAPLVYISTNEVFDGAASSPYVEYDHAAPINAYGRSKWAGEQAVRELARRFYIVRVAWLFGGERNFVRTVLRLADQHDTISMVADEIGSPTYVPDLAEALAQLIQLPFYGTYHLVNEGACSRLEFAAAILRLSGHEHVALQPIALADYQRASLVPPYTPLNNVAAAVLGLRLRPWHAALAEYLGQLGRHTTRVIPPRHQGTKAW